MKTIMNELNKKKNDNVTTSGVSEVVKDNVVYSGTHLLIDIWSTENLNDKEGIEKNLRKCAIEAGATILHSHMHAFSVQGVSGVIVLAESHISIHTWPERGYAAIDIFMCGECDPYKSIDILKSYFKPTNIQIIESRRGIQV